MARLVKYLYLDNIFFLSSLRIVLVPLSTGDQCLILGTPDLKNGGPFIQSLSKVVADRL